MIKTRNSIRDVEGNIIQGLTKLLIVKTDSNGEILESYDGVILVPEKSGTMFIVDDYVARQLDKIKMINNKLVVKDGETIEEPVKTERELKREELLRQVAELDAEEENENQDI